MNTKRLISIWLYGGPSLFVGLWAIDAIPIERIIWMELGVLFWGISVCINLYLISKAPSP